MENKQLFEKQANGYNPIFPLVRLEDIIETISDKSIQWILNNYNHLYVEYSESKAITRNKVPALLRRKGLWITYNANNELITEYFKGDNKDITNYIDWTHNENWERFDKLSFVDGSITYQHLSEAVKQLLGSGNTITNFPDEEDITTDGTVLSFKDRDYEPANFSGLGRVILRKNIKVADGQPKNVLTQDMINKENTIYEIRYDFNLNGAEITIPEGCVLDFQGGILNNGIVNGNNVYIYNAYKSLNNIVLKNCNTYYSSWFNKGFIESLVYGKDNSRIVINSDITLYSKCPIPNGSEVIGKNNSKIYIKGVHDALCIKNNTSYINLNFVGEGSESDIKSEYARFAMAGTASNVVIRNCTFSNFYSMSSWVVYFRKGDNLNTNILIEDCYFNGLGSNGNGVVGDTEGSVRAIYIHENYKDIIIRNNKFEGGYGQEDTDYISVQQGLKDGYYDSANVIIENNIFKDNCCSSIKTFASDVLIQNNAITGSRNYRGNIRCYSGKNVKVIDNYINIQNARNVISVSGCANSVVDGNMVTGTSIDVGVVYFDLVETDNTEFKNCILNIENNDIDLTQEHYKNCGLIEITGSKSLLVNNIHCTINKCVSGIYIKNQDVINAQIDKLYLIIDEVERAEIQIDNRVSSLTISNSNLKSAYLNVEDLKIKKCYFKSATLAGNSAIVEESSAENLILYTLNVYLKNYTTLGNNTNIDAIVLYCDYIEVDGLYGNKTHRAVFDARNFNGTAKVKNVFYVEIAAGTNSFILNKVNIDKFTFSYIHSKLMNISYGYSNPNINVDEPYYPYYNLETNGMTFKDGPRWIDSKGFSVAKHKGATEERPVTLTPTLDIGFEYFDITLGKPIYAQSISSNGTVLWVDATGANV